MFCIFLLTAPCGDVSASSEVAHASAQHDKNSEKQKHTDSCTAFCTCNCCGAQFNVVSVDWFSFSKKVPVYSEIIKSYHSLFQPGIPSGIWQPPKIG